ncbi:hemin-degrading factor [Chitinophaga arvensicola]|uniref:Putative hemin transport protein n=1 Tax=Chitinophaga arvensicola TaxID=29529 RepID=A0A1I0QHE9_9BACT|nr:ChuX/HutX family heme-like substrate-binding protein [Chitinophaga arvensicola]SEW26274.1 putative hemin transport protein [Chitinophaga arvensicola]
MEAIISPLKTQWLAYQQEHPKVRIRDAAKALKVSEAQLVASCTGPQVKHLQNDYRSLLLKMPALGRVMVLTRNESCVIERKGIFENVSTDNKHVGIVLGKDIDLRMFINKWTYGFALDEDAATGFKKSLQVFDSAGDAIIKIYAQPETDVEAWDALVAEFIATEQPDEITVTPAPAPPPTATHIDKEKFLADWAALKDTHDFFPMLMKHRAGRLQAVEAAEGTYTRKVDNNSVKVILEDAAATGLEIMVFVGNHGNIEIHTGAVQKILEIPGWINVMDPDFNLHLKTTDIAHCWVVDKPAEGGVTSLEVFDAAGEMIVQFFGKRKPGIPELPEWRKLLTKLSLQKG